MNGPHDVGGDQGFGPVAPERDEPLFHAPWEKRAMAVTVACGTLGAWTADEGRHARENLRPADYYASSYYEIWIKALENRLRHHGFLSSDDLRAGHAVTPAAAPRRVITGADVPAVLARGAPYDRPLATPPRFAPGDAVRARVMNPTHHTRLPRYARGKTGRIETLQGSFVFPDTNAHGLGENPQWLYTLTFRAAEIWGPEADPTLTLSIDAWESYLDPA